MNETIEAVQKLEKAIKSLKTIFEKNIDVFLLESGNQEYYFTTQEKMMKFIENFPNRHFTWSTVDLNHLSGEYVEDLLKIKFDSE